MQGRDIDMVLRIAVRSVQVAEVHFVVAFECRRTVVLFVVRLVFEVDFARIRSADLVTVDGLEFELDRIIVFLAALPDDDVA